MRYLAYVMCNVDGRYAEIPIRDYMDIYSRQYGFDSYEDLKACGYRIEIPENCITVRKERRYK